MFRKHIDTPFHNDKIMSEPFTIETPMGEIKIPYSEDFLLNFARKVMKVSEGEPNLLEEAVVDYLGIPDIDSSESDWIFWEENKVPIYLYDMMGWLEQDFEIEKKIAFSMSKRKVTGIQFHQFEYPLGNVKMPIPGHLLCQKEG